MLCSRLRFNAHNITCTEPSSGSKRKYQYLALTKGGSIGQKTPEGHVVIYLAGANCCYLSTNVGGSVLPRDWSGFQANIRGVFKYDISQHYIL